MNKIIYILNPTYELKIIVFSPFINYYKIVKLTKKSNYIKYKNIYKFLNYIHFLGFKRTFYFRMPC